MRRRRFDRIVYQVGNSEFHIGILERLLPRYPGVAMLHDAFLSNVALHTAWSTGKFDAMARALFGSHGWPAVKLLTEAGAWPAAIAVPLPIAGVSPRARRAAALAARAATSSPVNSACDRGRDGAGWCRSPGRSGRGAADAAARAALTIGQDFRRSCVPSALSPLPSGRWTCWRHGTRPSGPTRRRGWCLSETEIRTRHRPSCSQAEELGVADRVIQTGRVDEATYRRWLEAADIAIQLRTSSRGETSAAIADCMAVGLPVIANAHGSAAELPPDALVLLPDLADAAAIGARPRPRCGAIRHGVPRCRRRHSRMCAT